VKAPGLFALYVAGYSLARMGEELLRVDYSERILGLRLNFYVPTLLFLAGTAWFIQIQRGNRKRSRQASAMRRGETLLAAGGLLCLAGCGASRGPAPGTPRAVRSSARVVRVSEPIAAAAARSE
jgi:hypothetical protein